MECGRTARAHGASGFPRTRGDGVSGAAVTDLGEGFPPHTRGWSVGELRERMAHLVSPAHAGMEYLVLR